MKIRCLVSILSAAAVTASAAPAGTAMARAAVSGPVEVREVKGTAAYAYEKADWQPLHPGKVLRAGATVRAESGSEVLLVVGAGDSFVRVSPSTRLELTSAPATLEPKCPKCLGTKPVTAAARR